MPEVRVAIGQAKRDLSDLVNRVAYGGERILLMSRGKPKAALVSFERPGANPRRLWSASRIISVWSRSERARTWLAGRRGWPRVKSWRPIFWSDAVASPWIWMRLRALSFSTTQAAPRRLGHGVFRGRGLTGASRRG